MFRVNRTGRITLLGLGLTILIATAIAAVPGFFSAVDSTNGYTVGGAAGLSGNALCSDGSHYKNPCTVLSSAFYQEVTNDGTSAATQRNILFFEPNLFTLQDTSATLGFATEVLLHTSGTGNFVATYASAPSTSTNFARFDGNGNLVASSSAPGAGFAASWTGATGTFVDDGAAGSAYQGSGTWSTTVSGTYFSFCQTPGRPGGGNVGDQTGYVVTVQSQNSTTFNYTVDTPQNPSARGNSGIVVYCIAVGI